MVGSCAVWKGGIPASYSKTNQYPLVTRIFGIKNVTRADDLSKTVISYAPTNEILLNTNTAYGWIIQIEPATNVLVCEEFFILPKPARWGTNVVRVVSPDKTPCRTRFILPKGAKYFSDEWKMFSDDPLGEYEMVVFLDRRLAADFKYRVVAPPQKP